MDLVSKQNGFIMKMASNFNNNVINKKIIKKKYYDLEYLKKTSLNEFRHQLISLLKKIASESNFDDFLEIITIFRKEFINEGYFFIEFINRIILGLIKYKKNKLDYLLLYNPCLFLSQIGDNYTVDLLYKILPNYKLYPEKYHELKQQILRLKEKLKKLEEELSNSKLYPMSDIIDTWLD